MSRLHILAIGQSNLANHCGTPGQSAFGHAVCDGARHPMHDPVPGGTGKAGSVWPRVADRLQAAQPDLEFALTLAARGGTSIEEWAPGGPCFDALDARIAAGDTDGVTMVVFQQGEKDTLLETDAESYRSRFVALHAAVTEKLGELPWILCRSSWRFGVTSEAVTTTQAGLVAHLQNVYAGPDLDGLGPKFRTDNTHFNDAGLDAFADDLARAILKNQ